MAAWEANCRPKMSLHLLRVDPRMRRGSCWKDQVRGCLKNKPLKRLALAFVSIKGTRKKGAYRRDAWQRLLSFLGLKSVIFLLLLMMKMEKR